MVSLGPIRTPQAQYVGNRMKEPETNLDIETENDIDSNKGRALRKYNFLRTNIEAGVVAQLDGKPKLYVIRLP